MILSQHDIERKISRGEIKASRGGDKLAVEPASMDLHLGSRMKVPAPKEKVKVDEENTYPEFYERSVETPIQPRNFALAHTEEDIEIPQDTVGIIHGRSSVGRLGLFIHNAGYIDPGFRGQVTLELYNAASYPIELKEGMRICQIAYHDMKTRPDVAYSEGNGNKYNDQTGATPSRLFEDFE